MVCTKRVDEQFAGAGSRHLCLRAPIVTRSANETQAIGSGFERRQIQMG
jgi:hypothetical protein